MIMCSCYDDSAVEKEDMEFAVAGTGFPKMRVCGFRVGMVKTRNPKA